jgi:hypothetical protein
MNKLSVEAWTERAKAHEAVIAPYSDAFVSRRSIGGKHPVHDFLFTYYRFSPAKLRQWVPSYREVLEATPQSLEDHPWLNAYWFTLADNALRLDRGKIQENTRGLARFIAELCQNVIVRAPRFGCFGLHEWAMVYKLSQEEIRHNGYQLRIPLQDLEKFVESQNLCCTHYDAYRFFTPPAKPFNAYEPTLATRLEMEQAGCLHANMDLYKWSTKLWPWIGSEFIVRTFFLALKARELDMRASPYDLAADGYSPICIETEQGRRQYQKEQQQLMEESIPLRKELLQFCNCF